MEIFDSDATYQIKPVNHLIKKYLNLLHLSEKDFWKRLVITDLRAVFLLAVDDFENKKITIEEFSGIADQLTFNSPTWDIYHIDLIDSQLGSAMEDASEMFYYWIKDKDKKKQIAGCNLYKTVKDYFNKHKSLLLKIKKTIISKNSKKFKEKLSLSD